VEVIRLLRHRWELHGTLYFEFQPGVHAGLHWQPTSVYVREEFWADLGTVLARHERRYSHYGFTAIAAPAWASILQDFDALAAGLKMAVARQEAGELLPHLFRWHAPLGGAFWRRYTLQYGSMTRELACWIRNQLAKDDVVSVLGI
jgi:hypothetical protein